MLLSPLFPFQVAEQVDYPGLHIPDGFLSLGISALFWVVSIGLLMIAVRRTERALGERQIPLMGIMAAFIFAGQMINFPVAGGTSGHLLGGALAAIVLGPWAAMLVMTSVIGLQALLFQDGGLLVMGANIFNMGLLTVLVGYGLYRAAASRRRRVWLAVAGVGAWLSVMAGAFAASLQLWLSGTSALRVVLPAMLGIHALIGIGEALVTVAALAFISKTRPDLLGDARAKTPGGRGWVVAGGLVTTVVVVLAPLASANPDGLERVARDAGFLGQGLSTPFGLLSGYAIPQLGQGNLSIVAAGALGALATAAVVVAAGRLLRRSRARIGESG